MAKKKEKICFVIAPIGEPDTEPRTRSDQLLKYVIAPVVEPRGYKTVRADQIGQPGMITPQIIDSVRDSDLVIADLTGSNPNVFYELAIRHAEKKPLIQIMAGGERIPFDVQDMRTIPVDIHDLDSVAAGRDELTKQVDAIESGDFEMNTPISVALDLRALRDSGDPGQRAVADVLDAIAEVKALVIRQEQRLEQLRFEKALERSQPRITDRLYESEFERAARDFKASALAYEARARTPRPQDEDGKPQS